jgi:hypothetical protein
MIPQRPLPLALPRQLWLTRLVLQCCGAGLGFYDHGTPLATLGARCSSSCFLEGVFNLGNFFVAAKGLLCPTDHFVFT